MRECQADRHAGFEPGQAAAITVPVLLLVGGASAPVHHADARAVAAALPDATIEVLVGQQHVADVLAPDLVARHVLTFLR